MGKEPKKGIVVVDKADGGDLPVARRGRRPSSATTLEDIIAAARIEFEERGFEGARVEQMARTAGVSKQLIYHYFADKAALYGIILEEAAQDSKWLVDRGDYDPLPPVDALTLFLGRVFDDYVNRPAINRMTLDEAIHQAVHIRPRSELAPILRRMIDDVLTPILERGAAAGLFRSDVDASMLFWTIHAVTTAWFSQKSLMTLVSGPDFDGDRGAAMWREHSISTIFSLLRRDGPAA